MNLLGDIVVGVAANGDPLKEQNISKKSEKTELENSTSLKLNSIGLMIESHIMNIGTIYTNVKLDCFVVMPNHVHFIVVIQNRSPWAATPTMNSLSIPNIINSFKTITSKKCGYTLWQRNYYEHIVRNEQSLQEIRDYILNNPLKWQEDMFFLE